MRQGGIAWGEQRRREAAGRLRDSLLVAGSVLAAAAFVAHTAAHLANEFLLDKRFWHLDADVDGNAMTWASAAATLAAAVLALALARLAPVRRRQLVAVAVILAFFAVDDAIAIHEDLGGALTFVGLPDLAGIWFPIYAPLLGFVAAVLWTLEWPGSSALPALRVGLLLLGAAIVGEVVAAGAFPAIDRAAESWAYELEVALEEAAELAGWIVVATGLAVAQTVARRADLVVPESVPGAEAATGASRVT